VAHSGDQHSLLFMCRKYSSLSYCSVYFPVNRSIGQRYLNFEGRDLMVKGVVHSRGTSLLQHIFFRRAVRLQRSRLLSKINRSPLRRSTLNCLTLVHRPRAPSPELCRGDVSQGFRSRVDEQWFAGEYYESYLEQISDTCVGLNHLPFSLYL